MLEGMIDMMWNFPLLEEQQASWRQYLLAAVEEYSAGPVEMQRPSFRTVEGKLRERAARWLGFPAERTWLTGGGHHGLLNALFASGLAGTRFVLEGSSYPGFMDQCRATGTQMDACAFDEFGVLPESLRGVCVRARSEGRPVRGFFTMATVQNPLGFVVPLARRLEVVAVARAFDLVLIEDDAYGYMAPDAPPNYAVLAPERTFYVRGLAKSFAPGARTGFLVVPDGLDPGAMVTALRITGTGTDVPQNMAMLAMCEDGVVDRLMAAKRAEGAVRNEQARALLGERCWPGASAAWHLWVRLEEGWEPDPVAKALLEKGVLVSSGSGSAVSAEYRFGLRLALGGEVRRERMLEGAQRVREVLGS